jgi:hypothetical protein
MSVLFAGIENLNKPQFVLGLLVAWCCLLLGPPLLICLGLWAWSRIRQPTTANPDQEKLV